MNAVKRYKVLSDLDSADINEMVQAAQALYQESVEEDIPWLLELMRNTSFFVRESAAWPLAKLAGPKYLRELFVAYQLGFDEGHDNDGFTTALIECAHLYPKETAQSLQILVESTDAVLHNHAKWLLEFCEDA